MQPKSFLSMMVAMTLFAAAEGLASAPAQAADAAMPTPGFFKVQLGDDVIVALRDGGGPRALKDLVSNPEQLPAEARQDPAATVPLTVAAFLVKAGGKTILVDTGLGSPAPGLARGWMVANLEAVGVTPDQIDAVLLTHMHGDHIGGLSRDGARLFPKAAVYAEKREADYWLDPASEAAAPEGRKPGFRTARAMLSPYQEAGAFRTFDGAVTVLPGIQSVPAYGHTPGHTGFMLESKGQRMLIWGDIVHLAGYQFPNPEISLVFDSDAATARATRKAVMADAARQGYLIAGMHLPFPSIGHVRAVAAGYAWDGLKP